MSDTRKTFARQVRLIPCYMVVYEDVACQESQRGFRGGVGQHGDTIVEGFIEHLNKQGAYGIEDSETVIGPGVYVRCHYEKEIPTIREYFKKAEVPIIDVAPPADMDMSTSTKETL